MTDDQTANIVYPPVFAERVAKAWDSLDVDPPELISTR
jgi:hypothetical protein